MPVTANDVRDIVSEAFTDAKIDVSEDPQSHLVTGIITWNGFGGLDSRERHRLISERVRNKLGMRALNLGILFPLAPGEKL